MSTDERSQELQVGSGVRCPVEGVAGDGMTQVKRLAPLSGALRWICLPPPVTDAAMTS